MDQLREGLDGNVSYEKYRETIEYYESYFRRKIAEGKTEYTAEKAKKQVVINRGKRLITTCKK